VTPLDALLTRLLSRGRISFTREEALRALPAARLTTELGKLIRKRRLANPRQGFYLILEPKDQGAPHPKRWIHALMQHQGIDYRISLLTAAAFHGAAEEPATFQAIAARPLRELTLGARKLEFLPLAESTFKRTNRAEWLQGLKTDTGEAKLAGIELTLLDCAKWLHKAGGMSQVAQIARMLGARARPVRLAALARAGEGADARRLGYLLELAGHEPQAKALDAIAQQAKTTKLLDPSSKIQTGELSGRWKIVVNR